MHQSMLQFPITGIVSVQDRAIGSQTEGELMAVILQFLLFYKEDSRIIIEKPEHEKCRVKRKI